MDKIIKVNQRSIKSLLKVDEEANHQATGNLSSKEKLKSLKKRFDDGYELFYAYKRNNEIIAYITLKPFFPGHNHCEVYWLNVKKNYQCEGVGTKLIKYIENLAKQMQFRKVCVYTGKTMGLTRHFYEKNNFKLINEFPDYYGFPTGNRTAVLYVKDLK
ncbi:MAG: GNAT family N-acetyltransferase [archaeon]|jgi:ribosomal protein S18 acetylase RimI-like enzyme